MLRFVQNQIVLKRLLHVNIKFLIFYNKTLSFKNSKEPLLKSGWFKTKGLNGLLISILFVLDLLLF
ncbi:unnamed protein product [Paramecium sonneborni]|uniref:Uncharacterized protein n=1 Tax=Paramecium sonneborni TaxID=65129 RepID=A0A8S1LQ73_9CILI|nr:unnamed protein product [Paramecium sonneborni]